MKSVKCLLVAGWLFYLAGVNAQGGVNLRLDSNFIGLPGVVHLNDVDTLTIMINNDSLSTFHGNIFIGYNINGTIGQADTATGPLIYSYGTDSIVAQSFIVRTLVVQVIPPFTIGSSGVVIWPIASNSSNTHVIISDSLSAYVNVLPPVGIDEVKEKDLKVYMNAQELVIQDGGEYLLKSLKLYDVAGNLLQEMQLTVSGTVNMAQYAAGVYFARITFADNSGAVVKVINTR